MASAIGHVWDDVTCSLVPFLALFIGFSACFLEYFLSRVPNHLDLVRSEHLICCL